MKSATLLHNPHAGEGESKKNDLIPMIESAGFKCQYFSTKKKGWDKIRPDQTDLLIVAGGDGTVRKVAEKVLNKKMLNGKIPIGLLPLGTANNIARTLGIDDVHLELIKRWRHNHLKKYDVGRVYGVKDVEFFLESMGFGVFPMLIKEMEKGKKKREKESRSPEEELELAIKSLYDIILSCEATHAELEIDGKDYSSKYLLAEILNIRSIGPNVDLAPSADPGDGKLDVVLIREEQREEFANYVRHELTKKNAVPFFEIIKATKIDIQWADGKLHVDDELVKPEKDNTIKIELVADILEFLV